MKCSQYKCSRGGARRNAGNQRRYSKGARGTSSGRGWSVIVGSPLVRNDTGGKKAERKKGGRRKNDRGQRRPSVGTDSMGACGRGTKGPPPQVIRGEPTNVRQHTTRIPRRSKRTGGGNSAEGITLLSLSRRGHPREQNEVLTAGMQNMGKKETDGACVGVSQGNDWRDK